MGLSAGRLTWWLQLAPAGAAGAADGATAPIPLASGTGPVGSALDPMGAKAFTLDPAAYPSGDYNLVLTASDGIHPNVSTQTPVSLFSPAKLGGLTLPVTDLTVPVPGGQPITITRVYNSQNADTLGDFGYGWSLQATTSALRTVTEPASPGFTGTAFRPGDLVYITIPGGGQHVFQFWPVPVSYQPGAGFGSGADPYSTFYQTGLPQYTPQFLCVDGSGSTLSVPDGAASLVYEPSTRELLNGTGDLFKPANYTLTTSDGTRYAIDGSTGNITAVTDANDITTSYAAGSISTGGVNVRVDRNSDGLVSSVEVVDANGTQIGQAVEHAYNGQKELTGVTARDGTTTNYAYSTDPAFTTVTDPRRVPVLNALYNSLGELSSLTDASGNPATVATGGDDGSGDSQTVTDLTPQHNTTQNILDSEGNVIRQIKSITDSSGQVTGYQVTVHQYTYFTGDLSAEILNVFPAEGSTAPGFSNQNTISSQTDYEPFIAATLADALNPQSDPTLTATREVDFGAAGDSNHPQGLPTQAIDFLAGS